MGQEAEDLPAVGSAGDGRVQAASTLTRRVLLSGAAAAGAATLLTPPAGASSLLVPGALPRRRGADGTVSSLWVGRLRGESHPIPAPRQFSLVGIEWSGPAEARIELRTEAVGGRWGPWTVASVRGHDGDGQQAHTTFFGEPIWTGPATHVQLRTDQPVHGLRLHFVTGRALGATAADASAAPSAAAATAPSAAAATAPSAAAATAPSAAAAPAPSAAPAPAAPAAALPLALPILPAGPGQPAILARSGWAGRRTPRHRPTYGKVKLAFVHHTVTPNGYSAGQVPAILRTIFDYHVHVRGFWDIAYNFLIDAYGRIWEGRAGGIDMPVIGAQAGGYNTESTGVAVIGNFMNVAPAAAAIHSLERLLAWKLSLHGLPTYGRVTVVVDPADAFYTPFAPGAHVSLPRVAGHRDGDSTDCPGDALYRRLHRIRPRITALAGTPAVMTTSAPTAPVPAGSPVTVSGELALLGGGPLAGAPIELQELGPFGPPATTVATATTAEDGSWSASISAQQNQLVRAVHSSYPASVADWAPLSISPVLTIALESSAPLQITGTVFPGKRRVTVALYPSSRTTGKPLARRRVSALTGSFAATLPVPGPGSYLVVARTAADSVNAAAASAPLPVTVS